MKLHENRTSSPDEFVAVMRDATMTFDGYMTRALANANLEIRRGEVFGLLGPQCSGKSTALKLLAGRLRPTDGKISVFGSSPTWRSVRRRIGYLPGITSYGNSNGLIAFIKTFFGRATATSAVRRNITQVLASNPELVILDEPFSGLEEKAHREMRELILNLAQRGKTVVLSERLLADARDICDRIAIFHSGRVEAIGTLAELLASTEGIRSIAAVLPPAISESVLNLIQREISTNPVSIGSESVNRENVLNDASRKESRTEISTTTTTAETILEPLLQKPVAESPREVPKQNADPIDHKKLAKLIKP
jgi:ABC-type multidrug transport system ATPase subunit